MAWTDDEMQTATLIHGPDSVNTDTYRLHLEGDKYLDVPGWMVGDVKAADTRMRAARHIRERLGLPA